MSFNSSKRIIGFVIISLMGGSPLLALTKTSKKKQADTAAIVKAPRLSTKNRARNAGMHKQSKQHARAYSKNVKRKKSSKNTFLTHKKAHKKVASTKSKQLANKKKLSSKRMHHKAQVRKAHPTRKNARVAARALQKQTLPAFISDEPQVAH
ncbi:MAG: hypothetical protein WC365_04195 [Candidatus Babeliales bacterium]|jgi:hypothetical protein